MGGVSLARTEPDRVCARSAVRQRERSSMGRDRDVHQRVERHRGGSALIGHGRSAPELCGDAHIRCGVRDVGRQQTALNATALVVQPAKDIKQQKQTSACQHGISCVV